MPKTPKRITRVWCKRTRGKTQTQRKKCHKLIYGTSKVPKRKYKRGKFPKLSPEDKERTGYWKE